MSLDIESARRVMGMALLFISESEGVGSPMILKLGLARAIEQYMV